MKKIGLISVLCIAACNSTPVVEDKDAAPVDSAAPKATAVEVVASAAPTASAAVVPSAVVSAAPAASAVAPKK